MTDRLYYDDPYKREFDATVISVEVRGDRQFVRLDRTSFYPTSGGQPFDTGTLGAYTVEEVSEDADGEILHIVRAPKARGTHADQASAAASWQNFADAIKPGAVVHGVIDWPRRFDHMQQHSGQHVLSAAFDRLFGVRTISFHLGADDVTVDLAREMTPAEITTAEDEANQVVWEDRAVTIRYAGAEEAARLQLRKQSLREGTLRLIDIADCDLSACGGTHVSRTGAIGVVAISSWERFKGGQRVSFLCGGRALARFRMLRDTSTASTRLLSVLPAELPPAIERLQSDAKDHKRALAELETALAGFRAEELARDAEPHGTGRLVLSAVDATAGGLKALASAITVSRGFTVVLVSRSHPALVVAARSADVAMSAHEIVTALTTTFGGRGGGKPDLAQGGGLNGSPEDILRAARTFVEAARAAL
jgi:alanyl-tRNA synthetase